MNTAMSIPLISDTPKIVGQKTFRLLLEER